MPELNGEAFVPPFCPALNTVSGTPPKEGMIVTPDIMRVTFLDTDEPSQLALDVYLCSNDPYEDVCADVTTDYTTFAPDDKDGQNVAWLAELDEPLEGRVAYAIGEKYCERVRRCTGVIMRSKTLVCSALNQEALPAIIAEVRQELDG